MDTLWSWTAHQAIAYGRTTRHRETMEELRRLRRVFAELHPGYTLVFDTGPRPIAVQLRYWNREPSVLAAARELQDSAAGWLGVELYPASPDSAALLRFLDRVETYQPIHRPTVAVPGLSLHGQLRAFDFAVMHEDRVVATTSSKTIDAVWKAGGWADRLRTAVQQSGARLSGPMVTPPEPWHYERIP